MRSLPRHKPRFYSATRISLFPGNNDRWNRTGSSDPISTTIVNRILDDRVAILTDNALEDPRFEMGDSVIVDGIRSVMASPIWEDRTILGVLYVDSLDVVGGYQTEDLDILTAIGHQTALAIQRWKLTEMLREEAIKGAIIRQNLARFHPAPVVDLIMKGAADLGRERDRCHHIFLRHRRFHLTVPDRGA